MSSAKRLFVDPLLAPCFDTILDFLRSSNAPSSSFPILVSHNSHIRPPQYVLFNTEQLSRESQLKPLLATALLPECQAVWDYSAANVEILTRYGITARHVPIRSSPEYKARLQTYRQTTGILYDFGFCGSLSPRREAVLDALRDADHRLPIERKAEA